MKTKFFFALFSLMVIGIQAQNKSNALDKTFEKLMKEWYDNVDVANADWTKYYTNDACELGPDGRLTCGLKNIIDGFNEMLKMADAPPKFTYKYLSHRLINPDLAMMYFETTADIKIKGQQFGSPTMGAALVHKINGRWLIEFDCITPIMTMPEMK